MNVRRRRLWERTQPKLLRQRDRTAPSDSADTSSLGELDGTYAATTMRVVVTGSSGPIGQALCSHLVSSGHHVVRVVRRPVEPGEVALAWDPESGTIDAHGLEGADAVVHLAGAGVGDGRWTKSRKRVLVESRTRSTALLAGALAGLDQRPPVLVSASAIGFYGDRSDEILTEQSPPGDDFLAALCVRWEAEAAPRQRPASGSSALAPASC